MHQTKKYIEVVKLQQEDESPFTDKGDKPLPSTEWSLSIREQLTA